jgi:hypothetical protein
MFNSKSLLIVSPIVFLFLALPKFKLLDYPPSCQSSVLVLVWVFSTHIWTTIRTWFSQWELPNCLSENCICNFIWSWWPYHNIFTHHNFIKSCSPKGRIFFVSDILLIQRKKKRFDVFKMYMDLFWRVDH